MNHTAAIRQYINEHQDELFDASYARTQHFPLVEIKTFLKILDRLEAEGLIKKISRGVYAPIRLLQGIPDNPEALSVLVYNYYTSNHNGIDLGYVNYTNKLPTGKKKTVCGVVLTGADIIFDKPAREIVLLLELIENHRKASDFSPEQCMFDRAKLLASLKTLYSDALMREVLHSIHYQFSTVSQFCRLLDEAGIPHASAESLMLA